VAWSALPTACLVSAAAIAQPLGFTEEHLLLETSGVTKALLDKFAPGKPIADDDRGAEIAVLAAVKSITEYDLDRFAEKPTDLKQAIESGRGELWQVHGKLTSVTPVELSEEELGRVYPEFDELPATDPRRKIYRCELTLDGGAPATVVALR